MLRQRGSGAAERVFDVLDTPLPATGTRTDLPDPARVPLTVEDLTVTYPDRDSPALSGLSLSIEPGRTTALVGPSGCGKSTLLAVLLGFVAPAGGRIRLGDVDLAEADSDAWRARIAYVPQRPHLLTMSLRDNVALGAPDAADDDAVVLGALAATGAGELVDELPEDSTPCSAKAAVDCRWDSSGGSRWPGAVARRGSAAARRAHCGARRRNRG